MRVVIFIVILLLLLGGAAGAYFGLGFNPFAGDETEEVKAEPEPDPYFLSTRPFIVPIFEGQRIAWHVDMALAMEAENEEDYEYLILHANTLRDAFILELGSYMNLMWAEKRELDALLIKKRLRLVAGKIVGQGYVREVVITELNQRRPGTQR